MVDAINRRKKGLEKRDDNNARVRGVNQPRYSRDEGNACVRVNTHTRRRVIPAHEKPTSLIYAVRNYPFFANA